MFLQKPLRNISTAYRAPIMPISWLPRWHHCTDVLTPRRALPRGASLRESSAFPIERSGSRHEPSAGANGANGRLSIGQSTFRLRLCSFVRASRFLRSDYCGSRVTNFRNWMKRYRLDSFYQSRDVRRNRAVYSIRLTVNVIVSQVRE